MRKIKQLSKGDIQKLLAKKSKYDSFKRTKRDKNSNSLSNVTIQEQK